MASLSCGFFIYRPVWFVDTGDPRGLQVVLTWLLGCLYEGSLQTLTKALWSLRVTYMIHTGQEFQTTFPPLLHPTQPSSLDKGLKENSERRPYWAQWAMLAKMLWALDRKSILSLGLTQSYIPHSLIQLPILLSLSHLSPIHLKPTCPSTHRNLQWTYSRTQGTLPSSFFHMVLTARKPRWGDYGVGRCRCAGWVLGLVWRQGVSRMSGRPGSAILSTPLSSPSAFLESHPLLQWWWGLRN